MDKDINDQNNGQPSKASALAKLTHEFRAPLSSIIGFASVLLQNKQGNLGEKELLYVNRILYNSQHLLNLANGIMDISKAEVGFENESLYEDLDVPAMTRQILQMVEGQILDKNVELVASIPEQVKPLRTIPGKLKIILMNLFSNAVKFTDFGTVGIRLVTDPGTQEITTIEIHDTGSGIEKERLSKLLQPFSLDKSREWDKGYGLGLAITRSLCDQLHYRLEADSRVGKGSTFRLNIV